MKIEMASMKFTFADLREGGIEITPQQLEKIKSFRLRNLNRRRNDRVAMRIREYQEHEIMLRNKIIDYVDAFPPKDSVKEI